MDENAEREQSRAKNFAGQKKYDEDLGKIYKDIVDGFKEQEDREADNKDYWDIYNCKLSDNQDYDGDSATFIGVTSDAVEARTKRTANMLFPNTARFISCISESGDNPRAITALLEHYVKKMHLRQIVPALLRNSDIEGQMSLYVDWETKTRTVTRKVKKPIAVEVAEGEAEVPLEGDEVTDIEDVEITTQGPTVTVIPDGDLLVLPATANSIEEAHDMGGRIVVVLRLSKSQIKQKIRDGIFTKKAGKELLDKLDAGGTGQDRDNPAKDRAKEAGVQGKAGNKHAVVFQCWTMMELDGDWQPVEIHFGGENLYLGLRKNPYWCGLPPVLSMSEVKIAGSFKGKSRVAKVAPLQYQLNDIMNIGMDSAVYALQPIIMTDPVKNPRTSSMVLARGAVWETSPQDTQISEFPAVYKDAFVMVSALKSQIMESMDVNDSMLQAPQKGRRNAQQVAQQELAQMASISDRASLIEEGLFNPLLERIFEYDQQFRDEAISVKVLGEMGVEASYETIEPFQEGERYEFEWTGSKSVMGPQKTQQQIALMNVLRGIQGPQLAGRQIDLTPIVEQVAADTLGNAVARKVIVDNRDRQTMDPMLENEMLANNLPVKVSPMDDDQTHLQAHHHLASATGDPTGNIRKHMMEHMAAIQAKAMPKNAPPAQPPQGGPGPRPGAMPGQPRPMQQPAGAVHQDQMADPSAGRQ